MKKFIRTLVAVILTLTLVANMGVCLAAVEGKQYHKYDKVMLLGDSEASGFSDYGDEFSEFTRVDDSYAAYVADELGAELLPYACPGFRTVELRYLLDDTYRPDDDILFERVPHTTMDEFIARAPELRQAIVDTDMVMIGIGGNDWGGYPGWIIEGIRAENTIPEHCKAALIEYLETASVEDDLIANIIEIADMCNALDDFMPLVPGLVSYAFTTLWENWEWIIDYIYEKNPDVTLVVIGMFPTYYKTEPGAPDIVAQPDAAQILIEDAIINVGNMHMVNGQSKYGYIYVDTFGTVVESSHPTKAGQRFIADRILEELPSAVFPYTDVALRNPNYKAIEYVTANGIMEATSETTFSPDAPVTKDVLSKALNAITGDYEVTEKTSKVSGLELALTIYKLADKTGFMNFFNAVKLSLSIFFSSSVNATRGEAAGALHSYIKTFA